jgi:hypothetical protein
MIEPRAHLIHALAQAIAARVDVHNVMHWQFALLGGDVRGYAADARAR